MALYVTDTHPLVWYATGKHSRLSPKALRAFNTAIREEALIYVSAFVLWEIAMLLKVGRIALEGEYGDWTEHLMAQRGFDLADFNVRVAAEAFIVCSSRVQTFDGPARPCSGVLNSALFPGAAGRVLLLSTV